MTAENVHNVVFWALAAFTLFSGLMIVIARLG